MKTFRERFSVTKLVFILVIVSLCIFTGYYVFADLEDKSWVVVAFLSIAITITNFYFKDKNSKEYPDSLIEREEKYDLDDLDNNNKL